MSSHPILVAIAWTFSYFAYGAVGLGDEPRQTEPGLANRNRVRASLSSEDKVAELRVDDIPQLIEIIEAGDFDISHRAIRVLASFKEQARSAIPVLCKKLDDPRHWTRSAAADALAAIGVEAARPLKDLLSSPSGRQRAGAVSVLGQLRQLSVDGLLGFSKDKDPRVRIATAGALADLGRPAVPHLVALLSDPEIAVAVEATAALGENQHDPANAIPGLIAVLPRKDVGWSAARALGTYGDRASIAIPWIIKAYPLGVEDFNYEDEAELALRQLGEPREIDVDVLADALKNKDIDARRLAAKYLTMLGTKAKPAAGALETAAIGAAEEYVGLKRIADSTPDTVRDDDRDNEVLDGADELAAALWAVTHDANRFLALTKRIVLKSHSAIYSLEPTAWSQLPEDACTAIQPLLQHEDKNVRLTVLYGVSAMGRRALPLRLTILRLAEADDERVSNAAQNALGSMENDNR